MKHINLAPALPQCHVAHKALLYSQPTRAEALRSSKNIIADQAQSTYESTLVHFNLIPYKEVEVTFTLFRIGINSHSSTMEDPVTFAPCVVDTPPRHSYMPPAPASEEVSSCPADLEMLCELLIAHGVELASEFKIYAVYVIQSLLSRYSQAEGVRGTLLEAGPRLWRWLQQKLRESEAEVSKQERLPLVHPAEFPLRLQHMDFIADSFGDIKTQLQLMHAALDDLQQKGEQTDEKLRHLQGLRRLIPTCRCEPQDRYSRSQLSAAAPSLGQTPTCGSKVKRSGGRPVGFLSGTSMLQVDRLEVPM